MVIEVNSMSFSDRIIHYICGAYAVSMVVMGAFTLSLIIYLAFWVVFAS